MERNLTPKQAKFVAEYMKDSNGARAAEAAGYSAQNAKHAAHNLLHNNHAVVAALAEARNSLAKKAVYNLEQAMTEVDATIQFARETENANAMAKALELKCKLNGLLVEKHDHRAALFSLNISGIDDEPEDLLT